MVSASCFLRQQEGKTAEKWDRRLFVSSSSSTKPERYLAIVLVDHGTMHFVGNYSSGVSLCKAFNSDCSMLIRIFPVSLQRTVDKCG